MKNINWHDKLVKGFLVDISGVLYDSGENFGTAIKGSVEAISLLRENGLPFRLLTNESSASNEKLIAKLSHHGFSFTKDEIFSPIPAVKEILQKRSLRPHLLVHSDVENEFSEFESSNPSCVVIGDAAEGFSFSKLNEAFNCLHSMPTPLLYSLGKGKYYRHGNSLQLDVGAFTSALEFACGVSSVVVGKPSPEYFQGALNLLGISPEHAVMIGDDIESDVGGAQKCGIRGVLVKTGKFTDRTLLNSSVKPDFIAENFYDAVKSIIFSNS